jgi:hypothetical protein
VALRVKSHWHDEDRERSIDEIGGALGINAWRIARDKAINLHGEDFVYENDEQRMAVIVEYLIFQVQIVDRMAHDVITDNERRALITAMALGLARQVQSNSEDMFGTGDYGRPFIERLNERAGEYAELNFTDDGPSYPFMRLLGFEIQQIMGKGDQNRWVIDQVMDGDGPDVYRKLARAFRDLLA